MRSVFALTIFSVLAVRTARAEYRVFELNVTDTASGQSRTVTSTLDQYQYRSYVALKTTETVTVVAHWMCWERSDYLKALCPNPRPVVK